MGNRENNLIIICGTQRCGSTMIVADFRSTEVLGLPEEYFIPWTSQEINNPLNNFESIIKRASTTNGNASIKVMADQLDYIERNLANSKGLILEKEELHYLYPHVRKLFKNAAFIKINRLDIVAQAVSRLMSLKTGKNHLVDVLSSYMPGNNTFSNDEYNKEVEYNKLYLDEQVLKISQENTKWDCILKNWNLDAPINLIYEDCINDFSYLSTIGNKLGLLINVETLSKRKLKKIGNSKNDEFIQKYSFDSTDIILKKSEVDLIRDAALFVAESNNKLALHLMRLALKFRPNGSFIKKKVDEYNVKLSKINK